MTHGKELIMKGERAKLISAKSAFAISQGMLF